MKRSVEKHSFWYTYIPTVQNLMGRILIAKDAKCFHADKEDTDQIARMQKLIWVFVGRTLGPACASTQSDQSSLWVAKDQKCFLADSDLWSACKDLSRHWAHMHSCRKCCVAAHMQMTKVIVRLNRRLGWFGHPQCKQFGRPMRKRVLGHMRTAKAQVRLRICAVWFGPSLSANRIIGYWILQNGWREKRPGWYFAHAHDDLNLRILRM